MSVDLSILVRNDFYKTDDPEECQRYIKETVERLKKYFLSEDIIDDLRLEEDEFSFNLKPLGNIKVHLHKGCWEFETCYHYVKYFLRDKNQSVFMRRLASDCARAFGQTEAWITDEYHGWGGVLAEVSDSFEDWVKSKSNVEGWSDEIIEYYSKDFNKEVIKYIDFSTKYHDSFDEPKECLEQLSPVFPGYELLMISGYGNIILGKKEGKLFALDIVKEKLVLDYPIDGVNDNYNTVALEIYKDGKSALFNREGEQLTPFGEYDFEWHWGNTDDWSIDVTDNITGQKWTFPSD